MVEQPRTLLHKCNAQILGSVEDRLIVVAAHWTSDVLHATSCCSIDVVDEGEL